VVPVNFCGCSGWGEHTGMTIEKRRSVVMLRATLTAPRVLFVEADQQVPFIVGSHCIARFVH
jgi:hypothetical protein